MRERGTDESADVSTVVVPSKFTPLFTVSGALLGALVSCIVGPVVTWLGDRLGGAPVPLRLAAELPLGWAAPILAVVGAVSGFLIVTQWREDAGSISVTAMGVTIRKKDAERFVAKTRINRVARSGKELVILGADGREMYRGPLELEMVSALRAALAKHGYPEPLTSDPYDDEFITWVDGGDRHDLKIQELLRSRRRALADKQPGAAENCLEKLHALGVMVRDRDGHQQYREISHNDAG